MSPEATYSERDVVALLLADARTRAAEGIRIEPARADEYDWDRPCRYLPEQLVELARLADRCAAAVSGALTELCGSDVVFEPAGGVSQHYARQLAGGQDDAPIYVVDLADADGRATAACTVAANVGVAWVSRLLGGGAGGDPRDLSDLEADLLVDVVGKMSQAIASVEDPSGPMALGQARGVSKGPLSLGGDGGEEYCRFAFRRREAEEEGQAEGDPQAEHAETLPELCFLIASKSVDAAMGVSDAAAGAMTAEQTRQAITAQLSRVGVTAGVCAGHAVATMHEIMSLQPGDVLLLQRRCDEPAEVVIRDQTMLYGNLVRCGGQYAVQIVAWAQPHDGPPGSAS